MIRVNVDPRAALGWLNNVEEKQLPFAVSLALNRVANAAQGAERDRLKAAFKLRREAWNLQGIYISKADRATKASWSVTIRVTRDYLARMEDGKEKIPAGKGRLWQPNDSIFKGKVIGRSNPLHPKNLQLAKTGKGQIQGKERTFIVRTKGQVLVIQRTGKDQVHPGFTEGSMKGISLKNFGGGKRGFLKRKREVASTRLLYRLVERVKLPAKLQFVETVTSTVSQQWPGLVQQAMAEAIRGAR